MFKLTVFIAQCLKRFLIMKSLVALKDREAPAFSDHWRLVLARCRGRLG